MFSPIFQSGFPNVYNGSLTVTGDFTVLGDFNFGDASTDNFICNGTAKFADGLVGTPSIAFISDPDTGIYCSGVGNIAFAVGGAQVARINGAGFNCDFLVSNTNIAISLRGSIATGASAIAVKIGNGVALTTAGAKIVSFYSDAGSTERAAINYLGGLLAGAGTVLLPSLSFLSDPDTGFYNSNANTISVAFGGVAGAVLTGSIWLLNKLGIADAGTPTYNSPDFQLQGSAYPTGGGEDEWKWKMRVVPSSAATTTSVFYFLSQKNGVAEISQLTISSSGSMQATGALATYSGTIYTGASNTSLTIYGRETNDATAVAVKIGNAAALTTAGGKIASFCSDTGSTEKAYVDYLGSFNAGAGTALLPAFSFVGDPNSGFYSIGANEIGIATNGVAIGSFGTGSSLFINTIAPFTSGISVNMQGRFADGATAIATKFGNSASLTTAGAKIASFYSDAFSTEKAYIDKDGKIYAEVNKRVACGGGATGAGVTPAGTVTLEINGSSYYLITSAGA